MPNVLRGIFRRKLWYSGRESGRLAHSQRRTLVREANASTLKIDGSSGEGGGQVLRSALSLSMCTGRPFLLERIRESRPIPGLGNEHVACIKAAAEVCSARVQGVEVGSTTISFAPGECKPGAYELSASTVGSAVLIFQTVLPALMCLDAPSNVLLRGCTHSRLAPTFDFLQTAFLPMIKRLGPECTALLQRPGFRPAGGGRIRVDINPVPRNELLFINLPKRGSVLRKEVISLYAKIPQPFAQEQARDLINAMRWSEAIYFTDEWESDGPGMALTVVIVSENASECFSTIANRKLRQIKAPVADLVTLIRRYLMSDALVGPYLADQLLLPLALGKGGEFSCLEVTPHLRTQMDVIKRFLPVDFVVEDKGPTRGCNILVAT